MVTNPTMVQLCLIKGLGFVGSSHAVQIQLNNTFIQVCPNMLRLKVAQVAGVVISEHTFPPAPRIAWLG
jgi:hypothetical protein